MLRPARGGGSSVSWAAGGLPCRFSSVGLNRAAVSLCLFCWGAVWSSSFSGFSTDLENKRYFSGPDFSVPRPPSRRPLRHRAFLFRAWRPRLQTPPPPRRVAPIVPYASHFWGCGSQVWKEQTLWVFRPRSSCSQPSDGGRVPLGPNHPPSAPGQLLFLRLGSGVPRMLTPGR